MASENAAVAAATEQAETGAAADWEPDYGFCGMNENANDALAAALEAVRRRVCVYGGGHCDCKYGLRPDSQRTGGEQSGCPELREVINRLLHRPGTFAPEEVTW